MNLVITIDGPAGSGKTTTAKAVAKALDIMYLDTGAMYRAVALYMIRNGIDTLNEEEVTKRLGELNIDFVYRNGKGIIMLNGEDVSSAIRNEDVSQGASKVSTLKPVRDFLAAQQRKIGEKHDVVAEGRDMGTVVFPDSRYKFFMECSVEQRAKRRFEEYREKGQEADYENILEEIKIRDNRDRTREHAPLRMADDAILIDTTRMSKEEQIAFVVSTVETGQSNR